MTKKIYRGMLTLNSHGEGDGLLFIGSDVVADTLQDDLQDYGNYVTVSFYTTEKDTPIEVIQEEYMMTLMGLSDADFDHRYSDITGYLWTDESWEVGGHNLIELLSLSTGRFCHLDVEFSREPPA